MAYTSLLSTIDSVIKTNGANSITGADHQGVLHSVVSSLGNGYRYIGIATTATDPGNPDDNQFYITATQGTYTHFSGVTVNDGEIAILAGTGTTWTKATINPDALILKDTDPTALSDPAPNYTLFGTYGGKNWSKDATGNVEWMATETLVTALSSTVDDEFKYQAQADGIEANFRADVITDSGSYYPNTGANEIRQLISNGLYKKTNLILTPAGAKAGTGAGDGTLYPIKGSDFTVARNSTRSRVDEDGYIRQLAIDEAAIDYTDDLATISLEPQSTNKYLYPFAAEYTYSTKTGLSVELDASTAGSELVTNGDFATDTDWSKAGTASISGGIGNLTGDGTTGNYLTQAIPNTIGKTYKLVYEVTANSLVGGATPTRFYESTNDINLSDDIGIHTYYIYAVGTGIRFRLKSVVTSGDISIDNVSVKEVSGFASPFKDSSGNIELVGRKLVEDGSTGEHKIRKGFVVTNGSSYAYTIIVKTNGRNIKLTDSGNSILPMRTVFDFSSNTFTDDATNPPATSAFDELADGFYALKITGTAIADGTVYIENVLYNSTNYYAGDGTSGVYIAGIQFEEQSAATSFINDPGAAEGSETTRLQDDITVAVPSGTLKIVETFSDDTTNEITTIPTTYTMTVGKEYKSVVSYTEL